MSQRLHQCPKTTTNFDTVHCDAYATKLTNSRERRNPPAKSVHTRVMRECRQGQVQQNIPVHGGRLSGGRRQESGDRDVESGVRATKRTAERVPWSQLLKNGKGSGENLLGSLNGCDPLRTVHFLAKELQCKVQKSMPDDPSLCQMIVELQHALSRIPPESTNKCPAVQELRSAMNHKVGIGPRDCGDLKPSKLTHVRKDASPIKRYVMDNTCQTPRGLYVEPEKLQQHLEASSAKIEKVCKQMESLCSQLKTEKAELERLLLLERDKVKKLIKQVESEKQNNAMTTSNLQGAQKKNESLQSEVIKLQLQLGSQQNPSAQELRTFVQDLQQQKARAEEECMQLRQQLTLGAMEIEKYEAILQARDSQVKEIRSEMAQLQEVVNEQLLEMQEVPFSSDGRSSFTNTTTDTVS